MSTTAALVRTEIETKVPTILQSAQSLVIADQETYNFAAAIYKDAAAMEKKIEEELGTAKAVTHKAWKDASDRYNRFMEPVLQAKKLASSKAKSWEDLQEHIRQQQQREAEEQARKQEEDARLAEAESAQQAGAAPEEVDAILETPLPTPPVRVAPTFDRVPGVTRERPYSAKVVSLLLLVRYVAANPQYLNLVEANFPALNALARAQQNLLQIPGVKSDRF